MWQKIHCFFFIIKSIFINLEYLTFYIILWQHHESIKLTYNKTTLLLTRDQHGTYRKFHFKSPNILQSCKRLGHSVSKNVAVTLKA